LGLLIVSELLFDKALESGRLSMFTIWRGIELLLQVELLHGQQ
jgi:hypothetical protein